MTDTTTMLPKNQMTCWVVTDGRAGMENQCLGLAEALGVTPTVKRVVLRSPWRQLSPFLKHGLAFAHSAASDPIVPPWPDVLIASGRASVPASLYARKASGGKTLTVQIQNPVIAPSWFDLVVTPQHDRLSGANVISTRGSMHRVTSDMLAHEAQKFLPQIASLPSPRIAVLIGGSNSCYRLTPREMVPLTIQLSELVKAKGGSLMVTTSRRTGEANKLILQAGLHDAHAYVWDGQGANPYYGMLGLADVILVTCDSVNMASEACTTGKPVYIIDLPGGADKFRRFHQVLRDDGLTRPFTGILEPWRPTARLNEVQMVAERVRSMLAARGME